LAVISLLIISGINIPEIILFKAFAVRAIKGLHSLVYHQAKNQMSPACSELDSGRVVTG
jgi:hypothetical protein